MKIAVSDLRPNPFRHLERYPIDQEKVDALVRSIKDTTFWDNLLVRKDGDGQYEIAYGHHRLKALKQARVEEIDVPVRKLSDTDMARIMAHENMEEWGHSSTIEQETVRAIVEAYAEGKIELPKIKGTGRGGTRVAPTFSTRGEKVEDGQLYTAETLAEFLGWKPYKVEATLSALTLIEDKLANESQFKGLSTKQAQTVAQETRRIARETGKTDLARAVGKRLASGMRQSREGRDRAGQTRRMQDVTIHTARVVANQMVGSHRPKKPKTIPPIGRFADELSVTMADIFPTPRMKEKLDSIIQFRDQLGARERNRLVAALRSLARRAEQFADKLEG